MTLGDVLSSILEWFGDLWPIRTVDEYEQVLRLRHGAIQGPLLFNNGLFGRGYHVFWPFIDNMIQRDCKLQNLETETQTCDTNDGQTVTFSLSYSYRIHNLAKTYRQIGGINDTVDNEIKRWAAYHVGLIERADLEDELAAKTSESVKPVLSKWGITLVEIGHTNMAAMPCLRLITDALASGAEEDDE